MSHKTVFVAFSLLLSFFTTIAVDQSDLLVFVSVKDEHKGDPLQRLLDSAAYNNVKINILDNGIQNYKILNKALEPYKEVKDQIVLYLASPEHALIVANAKDIVSRFKSSKKRVLFAGDTECEPDATLSVNFPVVTNTNLRFLSASGFCGYADTLYDLTKVNDNEMEDQLYYVMKFIEDSLKDKLFGIDYYSDIFYVWSATSAPLKLVLNDNTSTYEAVNEMTQVKPTILISKGVFSVEINRFNDYLNGGRNETSCNRCEILPLEETNYPTVTITVFTFQKTSFLVGFLQKLADQIYPKTNINLFLYNCIPEHDATFIQFKHEFKEDYREIHYIYTPYGCDRAQLFERGVASAKTTSSDFLFVLESFAHLDNKKALKLLLETRGDRKVVGPLLKRPDESWTNFWGTLDVEKGYYKRSFDYLDIVSNKSRGIFSIPFIMNAYLIEASVLPEISYHFTGKWYNLGMDFSSEPDIVFCNNLRKRNIYFYVNNLHDFGHLVRAEPTEPALHPTAPIEFLEFYQMAKNRVDWQGEYIHPDFWKYLTGELTPEEPCRDVFRFRVVTDRFCDDLVDIMENFGQWSSGTNEDKRLKSGYENVPTRDIHMRQVGLHDEWLHFIKNYVKLLQKKVYQYYESDPPKATMQFVVRYRPTEQAYLRPHNDASTYTFNLALNSHGTDFQGGGVRFLRYNCSVTDTQKGYLLMHPGRLTHYHEGLETTNGTRYIAVTFVDP